MTKQELLKGQKFYFSNGERTAEVSWTDGGKHSWAKGYKIWFNGAFIASFITFPAIEKRLQELIEKWDLEEEIKRFCLITGNEIEEGWKIGDDYFSEKWMADERAFDEGFKDFDEMYAHYNGTEENDYEDAVDENYCYWSTWNE